MIPRINPDTQQDRWLADSPEQAHTEISCEPGRLYRFAGMPGPNRADGSRTWVYEPGDYRLIGFGKDVRTWQERCVYAGVLGKDDGKLFICSLADWAENFTLIPMSHGAATVEKAWGVVEGNEGREEG